MFARKLSLISIFVFFAVWANAQSPNEYYHNAANYYIQGQKKAAKQAIQDALTKYPNDPKLKQLAAKVNKLPDENEDKNENQQQQQQQDKKEEQDKKDKKDQQNKNQQQQQQQQQNQQPQMSKENAQQILDALMQDEKNTQDKAKKQQVRGGKKAEKDW